MLYLQLKLSALVLEPHELNDGIHYIARRKFIAKLPSRDIVKCVFNSQRKLNLIYCSAVIGAAALAFLWSIGRF